MELTKGQEDALLELLWDYMEQSKQWPDRVITGWGSKTKAGLVASIKGVINDKTL